MAAAIAAPLIGAAVSLFTKGCGPSAEEKQQMEMQTTMERTLMDSFNQRLFDQKQTIQQLNLGLSNVAAGKFPPGMDPATLAAFTSKAMTTTAASYRNASQAVQSALAGRGGGAASPAGLLSGPESMVLADIAGKGAMEESELLQNIQMENFQLGRENYMNYVSGLSKMAELQDPSKFAVAMGEMTKSSTGLAEHIGQERSQMASDIGTAAMNVVTGIGAMGKAGRSGDVGQFQQRTQQQTNRMLTDQSGGLPPGSVNISDNLVTPTASAVAAY